MPRQTFGTHAAPAPVAAYSQACRNGNVVALAGQVGVDPATGRVVRGGVGAQTEQALKNVVEVLAAAGCELGDVIRMDCFLSSPDHFEAFNEVYARWFPEEPPTRTTVFVGLGEGLDVEITALAVA